MGSHLWQHTSSSPLPQPSLYREECLFADTQKIHSHTQLNSYLFISAQGTKRSVDIMCKYMRVNIKTILNRVSLSPQKPCFNSGTFAPRMLISDPS